MADWSEADKLADRAHRLFEAGRFDEAESTLRRAIAMDPTRTEWYVNLGLTLEAAGRHEDAIAPLTRAHELSPDDAEVALMLGACNLHAGSAAESVRWLERAEALGWSRRDSEDGPGSAPGSMGPAASHVHRIEAYTRLGDHDHAEVMFYLAQQIDPKDPGAFVNLAESLLMRDQTERALWCLREAAQLDPTLPGVHARLAQVYARTGRLERARQLYLVELRRAPGDIAAILDLARLLTDMNRLPEADEKFRRVLELDPENAEAYFGLAEVAERRGLRDEALGHYGVVRRLDEAFPGVRRREARLLLATGVMSHADRARALLGEELAAAQQNPAAFGDDDLADLGRLLLDSGASSAARGLLEGVAQRRATDARALHDLALACLHSADLDAGIELCRDVLRIDPRYAPAMHNLAVAYVKLGQWTRARYWARLARQHDPDDSALRRLGLRLSVHVAHRTIVGAWGWTRFLLRRRARVAPARRTK